MARPSESRIQALEPFRYYGPDYVRGVSDAILEAERQAGFGNSDSAEFWLRRAELLAGLRSFEEV